MTRGESRSGEMQEGRQRKITVLERQLFFGDLPASERSQVISQLQEHDNALADFATATLAHERFRQYAENLTKQLTDAYPNVPYAQITREQADVVFACVPFAQQLQEEFITAIESYEKSVREGANTFGGLWITAVDARLLMNDIVYLRSLGVPVAGGIDRASEGHVQQADTKKDREALLTTSEKTLVTLIDSFIKEDGKKAEYQIIFLLRHLLRAEGLEHLMQVTHGLPREDRREGVDVRIVAGGQFVDLDLKMFDAEKASTDAEAGVHATRVEASQEEHMHRKSKIASVDKDLLAHAYTQLF